MFSIVIAAAVMVAGQPADSIRLDQKGRPMIAMQIDDRGPFDMLVDTAAQTSVFTTALVEMLGLTPLDKRMTVNGVSGRMEAAYYPIGRMQTASLDLHNVAILALPQIGVTQARGIIGIDLFADRKLVFDLANRQMRAIASGPAEPGTIAVKGKVNEKGLLTVPITVDGVVIDALVDTGAEGSVANAAAMALLGWRDDDPRLRTYGTITGATQGGSGVRSGIVGKVALGPVTFGNVPLLFTGQADQPPRIILGMDMLGLLRQFALDLPRGELQILVPSPPVPPSRAQPPKR